MTFHNRPYHIKKAAAHLLGSSGFRTKDQGDPLEVLARKFGDHATQMLTKLGATNEDLNGLKAQLADMEQRMARAGGGGSSDASPSFGEQFIRDEKVKSFLESDPSRGKADFRTKATLTTAITNAAGSIGAGTAQAYRDTAVTIPRRRLQVRDLLPVIQISSGSAEWPAMVGRTNNAGMVAEGAAKPSSDMQLELKTTSAKVIAHWMKASKQVLGDFPQLRDLIDTELMDGLKLKEEDQLLKGDGTGQNLLGLIPQATAYSAVDLPILADLNIIDIIALAMLQLTNANYEADGAIINAGDWISMRLLKDGEGRYILGSPMQNVPPNIWGLPLVPTTAMTSRKFLVGQYQRAAKIYDRWEARIEVGYENDDFTKNLVTVLAEERLALGVKEPAAMIYGDFDVALAA